MAQSVTVFVFEDRAMLAEPELRHCGHTRRLLEYKIISQQIVTIFHKIWQQIISVIVHINFSPNFNTRFGAIINF